MVSAGPMADTVTATEDQKARAAIAYILTWITGLIIFFTAKKEERYARWHAVQAIALGIALFVLSWIVNLALSLMAFTAGGFGFMPMFGLGGIVWLLGIVLIIVLAVKAYQGETIRLPLLADFADKYA